MPDRTNMAVRPLPRSLDPLPGEVFTGYLLRLAHRLDLSPSRVAVLAGLAESVFTQRTEVQLPVSHLLHLEPPRVSAFAHATRLSEHEIAQLCLSSLAPRYAPLGMAARRHERPVDLGKQLAKSNSWVLLGQTRYCPQCLAGDGSTIQRRHGGPWQKLWRLAPVFACPAHRRLLLHLCPACKQPVHFHRHTHLLSRPGNDALHPVQCRSDPPGADRRCWRRQPCAARLDTATGYSHGIDLDEATRSRLFLLQQRLLHLLSPDGPDNVLVAGMPAPAPQYFVDLRIGVALVRVTWPEARDLAASPSLADALDADTEQRLHEVRSLRGHKHRRVSQPLEVLPLEAHLCGGVLDIADQLLTGDDPHAARERFEAILARAVAVEPQLVYRFRNRALCSDALRTAMAQQRRSRPVRRPAAKRSPSRRHAFTSEHRFGPQHIPAFLLDDWYDRHLSDLGGVNPVLLRRTVAMRLIRLAGGASRSEAAEMLAIPTTAAVSASVRVHRCLRAQDAVAGLDRLASAIQNLAWELDEAANQLIDYQARRRALANWSFAADEWRDLIAELEQNNRPNARTNTEWGDRKMAAASVLVWMRVTQGEHLFAPLVLAEKRTHHRHSELRIFAEYVLRATRRAQPDTHYGDLKRRLDAYADRLATEIDGASLVVTARKPQVADH